MATTDERAVDRQRLQELRDAHIGRLLLQAQRAFNAQAIRKLRARGHGGLGLAHTALLPHLDLDGTRITTLAERAGMTKQGMGQLVRDLERRGYVARAVDPADHRATLVSFTEAGWQFLRDAHAVKRELEAEYAAVLGEQRLDDLRATLTALVQHERG
ncbi:MAG TPA: MarR family winged helix-turn-helix transcriptional regulator [Thermomicrobiales bacterium]|nr:MarR family winged helix-turn-helix transcriptional regulator [Thermomicrobiales bacterium]